MHPGDCPNWEYSALPNAADLVADRCGVFVKSLRSGLADCIALSLDTRPVHERMFVDTTPPKTPYYAGHYRGEKFRCLEYLNVQVPSDPRVGVPVERVAHDLSNLSDHIIKAGYSALKIGHALPSAQVSDEDKLYYVVVFACRVLVEFLRIHPYANGNGHMGRFIVWLILGKFGYWPKTWPMHESPPYHDLLATYRDGNPKLLEAFVLRCL